MSVFQVDLEIGGKPFTIELEASDAEQARTFAQQKAATPEGAQEMIQLAAETTSKDDDRSVLRKAWDALTVPEELSREGLTQIAEAIPKRVGGGVPSKGPVEESLRGAPRIAAETLAEVAPSFVSRGSLLAGGLIRGGQAAAPIAKAVGKTIAKGAESISGLKHLSSGVLTEVAKDPSLLVGAGKETARTAFKGLEETGKGVPKAFAKVTSKKKFVEMAHKLFRKGKLNPQTAFAARKELDAIKDQFPKRTFRLWRKNFDTLAKKITEAADTGFQRAIRSEALRTLLPVGKTGEPAFFRMGLAGLGGAGLGVPGVGLLLSPALQGLVAASTGVGAKALSGVTPAAGAGLSGALQAAQSFRSGKTGQPLPAEKEFQDWFKGQAKKLGLNPDPDDPRHFYDWRAAFAAGAKPDAQGHWPSEFKLDGHPNLIIEGRGTRTDQPVGTEEDIILDEKTAKSITGIAPAPPGVHGVPDVIRRSFR